MAWQLGLTVLGVLVVCSAVDAFDATKQFRCKCVCPKGLNQTADRTVFINGQPDPRDCKCENVVPNPTLEVCLRCKCLTESFNGVLSKAIIFLILGFFFLLAVVLVWQCSLEVYGRRNRRATLSVSAGDTPSPTLSFQHQRMSPIDEDGDPDPEFSLQGRDRHPSEISRSNTPFSRTVRRVQNTVVGAQQELQRQRTYVYDRHALLS